MQCHRILKSAFVTENDAVAVAAYNTVAWSCSNSVTGISESPSQYSDLKPNKVTIESIGKLLVERNEFLSVLHGSPQRFPIRRSLFMSTALEKQHGKEPFEIVFKLLLQI